VIKKLPEAQPVVRLKIDLDCCGALELVLEGQGLSVGSDDCSRGR
jgi:hypothetical protein